MHCYKKQYIIDKATREENECQHEWVHQTCTYLLTIQQYLLEINDRRRRHMGFPAIVYLATTLDNDILLKCLSLFNVYPMVEACQLHITQTVNMLPYIILPPGHWSLQNSL